MPSLPCVAWLGAPEGQTPTSGPRARPRKVLPSPMVWLNWNRQWTEGLTFIQPDSCSQNLEGALTRKGQPCGKGGETLLGGRAEAKPLGCFYCGEGLPGSRSQVKGTPPPRPQEQLLQNEDCSRLAEHIRKSQIAVV